MLAGFACSYLGLPITITTTDIGQYAAGAPVFASHVAIVLDGESLARHDLLHRRFHGEPVLMRSIPALLFLLCDMASVRAAPLTIAWAQLTAPTVMVSLGGNFVLTGSVTATTPASAMPRPRTAPVTAS